MAEVGPVLVERVQDTGAKPRGPVFTTVLFSAQIKREFFSSDGTGIDGVVFAFDDARENETQWSATLQPQLDRALSGISANTICLY